MCLCCLLRSYSPSTRDVSRAPRYGHLCAEVLGAREGSGGGAGTIVRKLVGDAKHKAFDAAHGIAPVLGGGRESGGRRQPQQQPPRPAPQRPARPKSASSSSGGASLASSLNSLAGARGGGGGGGHFAAVTESARPKSFRARQQELYAGKWAGIVRGLEELEDMGLRLD